MTLKSSNYGADTSCSPSYRELLLRWIWWRRQQGGRSWQPFGEGKNGHETFVKRNYYFRDKCDVFARNCKFGNLTQHKMQYLPCNSALLVQETLFLRRKKNTFICPKISKKKVRKSQQISISRQNMLGLKIFVRDQTFRQRPFVPLHNFCHSGRQYKINVNYPRNYQLP